MDEDEDMRDALLAFLQDADVCPQAAALFDDRVTDESHPSSSSGGPLATQQPASAAAGPAALFVPQARAKRALRAVGSGPISLPASSSGASGSTKLTTSATAAHGAARDRRDSDLGPASRAMKRRPTPQQKVAELERRVAEEAAKLQRLSQDNTFMAERVRMLELVIDVREVQLERLSAIQAGLQHNPFEFLGKTVKEMRAVTPHEAAAIFTDIFGRAALKVVPLLPVLEQHPSLIVGPVPGIEWVALRDRRVPLPQGVDTGNPEGWTTLGRLPVAADVVQDVYQLVMHVHSMQRLFLQLFFLCPQLIVACGVHMQAVDPEEHDSWKALAATISSMTRNAAEGTTTPATPASPASTAAATAPSTADAPRPPLVAPQSHWSEVISHIRLTDRQKLQAAALTDIMARPLSEVLRQRTELAALLTKPSEEQDGAESLSPTTPSGPLSTADAAPEAVLDGMDSTGPLDLGAPGVAPLLKIALPGGGASGVSGGPSTGSVDGASSPGCSSRRFSVASKGADRLQEEDSLLKELQYTLAKESALIVLACETFYRHIITPVQLPLIMINAYPYILDTLALIHAIAEKHVRPGTDC